MLFGKRLAIPSGPENGLASALFPSVDPPCRRSSCSLETRLKPNLSSNPVLEVVIWKGACHRPEGGAKRGLHRPACQNLSLLVADHQDMPANGSADASAAGPPETHQPLALPETRRHPGVGQKPYQSGDRAPSCPESVPVKQLEQQAEDMV